MSFALSQPIRTVLRWQLLATAFAVVVLGWFAGTHGAISAALGGAISITAGVAAAWYALRKPADDAASAITSALMAEGLKVFLIVAGLAAALLCGRILQSLLYDTHPRDPVTFVTITGLLAAVAFFACWLPARRATKVDPMVALRAE